MSLGTIGPMCSSCDTHFTSNIFRKVIMMSGSLRILQLHRCGLVCRPTCLPYTRSPSPAYLSPEPQVALQSASIASFTSQAPESRHSQQARRSCIQARAGRGGSPAGAEESLPDSREEAIAQAAAALESHLPSSTTKKARKGSGAAAPGAAGFTGDGKKLTVEIPVADESDAAALELARDLLAALPTNWQRQFTIIACGKSAPVAPSTNPYRLISLDACLSDEEIAQPSGCVLFSAPKTSQLAALESILARWRGPAAVLLNAEWAPESGEDSGGVPAGYTAFARSFEAAYCFLPILIKAFVVSRQEGAVFRVSRGGGGGGSSGFGGSGRSGGAPWRVYMQQGGTWEAVGRMQRRPSSKDVEAIFYNASAAKSPLTQGAKFLRGLTQKKE